MEQMRRPCSVAILITAAALFLSGCATPNVATEARETSVRKAATALSDTVDCLGDVQFAGGEDLVALAKLGGLCGNGNTLGATDDELSAWKWDAVNTTWLTRIEESGDAPILKVLTVGEGDAQSLEQHEVHRLIVCWQATLSRSEEKPLVSGIECPQAWLGSWGDAEVMTLRELKKATSELGVELKT